MALARAAERVAAEFEYPDVEVNRSVQEFIREMDEGLTKTGATMSQIPTYVTAVPNGTEKGLFLAVDLGGTNFRVCSVQLHGNSSFSLTQNKVAIPRALMQAKTSRELFAFLAHQIEAFLIQHHGEHYQSHKERRASLYKGVHDEEIFSLGFTFSFPVHQVSINEGTLIRWTKGFDIPDAIGKDVCALLQAEIDALGLPVRVAALVNDTVGTLMARSYTSPGKTGTLLGAIFGTGTNGAYVEKLERITKLKQPGTKAGTSPSEDMIVNTEWGSFDNHLSVLPNTPYDQALDAESVNPGIQMFEKRVSGMFLGEILRRALIALLEDPKVPLFHDKDSNDNDIHSTTHVAPDSPLHSQWGLDTSFLSITAADASVGLKATRQALDRDYGVSAVSAEDAEAVRLIASAIGKRAARLAAVAVAAIVLSTGKLSPNMPSPTTITSIAPSAADNSTSSDSNESEDNSIIDVGVDGSLVEFYPNFEDHLRAALRAVPEIGVSGEKRIRIGIAKDGSGVGAALIALVADQGLASKAVLSASNRHFVGGGSVVSWLKKFWENIDRDVRFRV
jgi:hexokinase